MIGVIALRKRPHFALVAGLLVFLSSGVGENYPGRQAEAMMTKPSARSISSREMACRLDGLTNTSVRAM